MNNTKNNVEALWNSKENNDTLSNGGSMLKNNRSRSRGGSIQKNHISGGNKQRILRSRGKGTSLGGPGEDIRKVMNQNMFYPDPPLIDVKPATCYERVKRPMSHCTNQSTGGRLRSAERRQQINILGPNIADDSQNFNELIKESDHQQHHSESGYVSLSSRGPNDSIIR